MRVRVSQLGVTWRVGASGTIKMFLPYPSTVIAVFGKCINRLCRWNFSQPPIQLLHTTVLLNFNSRPFAWQFVRIDLVPIVRASSWDRLSRNMIQQLQV